LTYQCQKEHNKRMDLLMKHPELLAAQVQAGDFKASQAVLKAFFKMLGKG